MIKSIPFFFYTFLYVISFLGSFTGQSQEVPQVINYSPMTYNASYQNWSLAQDSDRTIYIANSDGLLSFNGSDWILGKTEKQKIVRAVTFSDGKLFTGGFGEIGYWLNSPDEPLKYFSLSHLVTDNSLEKEEIWNIISNGDKIYFQSFSMILVYDGKTVQRLTPPGNIMFIHKIRDRMLLEVIDSGIYELFPDNSFELLKGTEQLSGLIVSSINNINKTDLLIATNKNGVFYYKDGKTTIWNPGLNNTFKEYQINKVIQLKNGNYVFGTIRNGIMTLKPDGSVVSLINKQKGLQNNTVLALMEDVDGNIWVGLDKGISYIRINTALRFHPDTEGKLGTVYSALAHKGHLYLGTNQGIYYNENNLYEKSESNPIQFSLLKGSQGHVWQIKKIGEVLLAGHNDGTFIIEKENCRKISDINGGYCMLDVPGRNDLLIQSTYTGLILLKDENGWKFSNRINGFNEPVKMLIQDESGYLWMSGPISGIYRIKIDSSFRNISFIRRYGADKGITNDYHPDLVRINNEIFLRTNESYLKYNTSKDIFEKWEEQKDSKFDFSLRKGIDDHWFKVYRDQVEWYVKDQLFKKIKIRLQKDYFNISILENDTYLFCMDEGYATLPADISLIESNVNASLIIDRLFTNNQNVYNHLTSNKQILIPYTENSVFIDFHQAIFHSDIRFRVKLTGLDTDWRAWSHASNYEFRNLNPGKYKITIQSDYNDEIAELDFEILKPWYKSNIARVFYLLAFITFVYLLSKNFNQKLARAEDKIKADNLRILREHKIELDNQRLKEDNITKSKELANSTIHLVRKNEILLEIKEELANAKKNNPTGLTGKEFQRLTHLINENISTEEDWNLFESSFNDVHEAFMKKLKATYPDLSSADLRLAAYLRMNLSSKEIAPLFNISIRGLENKRYRLRKKINLSNEANLNEFFMEF